MRNICKTVIIICIVLMFASSAYAEDKTWSGSGDGTSWTDADNWFPENEPTLSSDVAIDSEDASVVCDETFNAKSVSIGGRNTSQLTAQNFIYGTIEPASTSDNAILNQSGGTFKLQGSGVMTLRGTYTDTEGTLVSEPSFMFWVE